MDVGRVGEDLITDAASAPQGLGRHDGNLYIIRRKNVVEIFGLFMNNTYL